MMRGVGATTFSNSFQKKNIPLEPPEEVSDDEPNFSWLAEGKSNSHRWDRLHLGLTEYQSAAIGMQQQDAKPTQLKTKILRRILRPLGDNERVGPLEPMKSKDFPPLATRAGTGSEKEKEKKKEKEKGSHYAFFSRICPGNAFQRQHKEQDIRLNRLDTSRTRHQARYEASVDDSTRNDGSPDASFFLTGMPQLDMGADVVHPVAPSNKASNLVSPTSPENSNQVRGSPTTPSAHPGSPLPRALSRGDDKMVMKFGAQWGADDRSLQSVLDLPTDVRAEIIREFNPPPNTTNVSVKLLQFARLKAKAQQLHARVASNLPKKKYVPEISIGLPKHKREACEAIRMAIFGDACWQGKVTDKEKLKIFEESRGTEKDVIKMWQCWKELDEDDSGDCDIREFLHYFRHKGLPYVAERALKGAFGNENAGKPFQFEQLMCTIWPRCEQEDIDWMKEVIENYKMLGVQDVAELMELPDEMYMELIETFQWIDADASGAVSVKELLDCELFPTKETALSTMAKFDLGEEDELKLEQFLEVMCPVGYQVPKKDHGRMAAFAKTKDAS